MTLTVSVSELRSNISTYLTHVSRGTKVLIRDEKKHQTIAQITPTTTFNPQNYTQALKKAAGIFSPSNHPEWSNKASITKWLHQSRLKDERSF